MKHSLWYNEYTVFEDVKFPLTGQRLTTSAGRLDFDFTECTVEFSATARYPEEPVCMIAQMPHQKKQGSDIRPHIHWVQTEDKMPNWLLAYRFYNNGETIPEFSYVVIERNDFEYESGSILQISDFPHIAAPDGESVSAICDFILYRDSQNVSTLFAGIDPYTATAAVKEFDIHIEIDSDGSRSEYKK